MGPLRTLSGGGERAHPGSYNIHPVPAGGKPCQTASKIKQEGDKTIRSCALLRNYVHISFVSD